VGYKYAQTGPPFNFLGHISETQWAAFKQWVNTRAVNFPDVQVHHQIRAQQLRKTAGVLEAFYAKTNDQKLTPTQVNGSWPKEAWQPGTDGHFNYSYRDDHLSMVAVNKVKDNMQEQFERDDDGVFFMNHLRNIIESHEDNAQYAKDAQTLVTTQLSTVDNYFAQNQFQAVLVKDQSDQYKGGPRFRVHQLDEPTQWEKEQANHSAAGDPIQLKEPVDPGSSSGNTAPSTTGGITSQTGI